MKTLKKLITGLSTKVYKFFLSFYFNTKQGKDFSKTYGLSFDPDIMLSRLPIILPSKEDFYTLASDLNKFEVLNVDEEKVEVTIREICTDNEFTMSIDLFDALFVRVERPNIDDLLDKAKIK